MTKTDLQLKQDVDDELRWDPEVNAAQLGVEAGAVSLKGEVDSYGEKWAAEDAADSISIKAVASVGQVQEKVKTVLQARASADANAIGLRSLGRYRGWGIPLGPALPQSQPAATLSATTTGGYSHEPIRTRENTIVVNTSEGIVTLSGKASSWRASEDATGTAWAAPGVTRVIELAAIAGIGFCYRLKPYSARRAQ